jgi:hypothetical protein
MKEGNNMAVEAQTATDLEFERKSKEVEATNKTREGIGTRLKVGRTRGKGSQVITFEQFDESKPETLPITIEKFMEVTGIKTEYEKDKTCLVSLLIAGFNDDTYTAASDPLSEFVENVWPADAKLTFRTAVRNYSKGVSVSLEDAASLIRPGFVKQFGSDSQVASLSVNMADNG